MKKKWLGVVLSIFSMLMLLACQEAYAPESVSEGRAIIGEDIAPLAAVEEDVEDIVNEDLEVYVPNSNWNGFDVFFIGVEEINPQYVLNILTAHEALPQGTELLSFQETYDNGMRVLELDFSEQFEEYLLSLSTTGEQLVLGSVVNTYLLAFEGESMVITIHGENLVTNKVNQIVLR